MFVLLHGIRFQPLAILNQFVNIFSNTGARPQDLFAGGPHPSPGEIPAAEAAPAPRGPLAIASMIKYPSLEANATGEQFFLPGMLLPVGRITMWYHRQAEGGQAPQVSAYCKWKGHKNCRRVYTAGDAAIFNIDAELRSWLVAPSCPNGPTTTEGHMGLPKPFILGPV